MMISPAISTVMAPTFTILYSPWALGAFVGGLGAPKALSPAVTGIIKREVPRLATGHLSVSKNKTYYKKNCLLKIKLYSVPQII